MYPFNDYFDAKETVSNWLERQAPGTHVALGVGFKQVSNSTTKSPAVQIFVTEKRSPSNLGTSERLPSHIDGIPLDVVVSQRPRFSSGPPQHTHDESKTVVRSRQGRTRIRPLRPGISCANRFISSGTLGCFCVPRGSAGGGDPVYILSSSHVLDGPEKGPKGRQILQAAPSDGGTDRDVVAHFEKSIDFGREPETPHTVEAGLARLLDSVKFTTKIHGIGKLAATAEPKLGMTVVKRGRTTGITYGIVTSLSYDTSVTFGYRNDRRKIQFKNQVRIEPLDKSTPFARFGDSGSLIVDMKQKTAAAMYFAGPADGHYGVATPITRIEEELDVSVLL